MKNIKIPPPQVRGGGVITSIKSLYLMEPESDLLEYIKGLENVIYPNTVYYMNRTGTDYHYENWIVNQNNNQDKVNIQRYSTLQTSTNYTSGNGRWATHFTENTIDNCNKISKSNEIAVGHNSHSAYGHAYNVVVEYQSFYPIIEYK